MPFPIFTFFAYRLTLHAVQWCMV